MIKTRTVNLDEKFVPIQGGNINIELFQFSGGEWHVKLEDLDYSNINKVIITNRFKDGNDIMKILIVKDAFERVGVKEFELIMPYIPYARQDRQCAERESFSLKVFTNIINSANFDKVWVIDSHSDVAPALINNCVNISNKFFLQEILADFVNNPILISPDAGANKKCNKLAIDLGLDLVKCDKIRDVKTGNLSGFEVFSNDLLGRDCLIVDDICDGGGTFIGLAQELKKKNAGDLYLGVTHGIFSKGVDIFKSVFEEVYCTNSFSDINDPYIKQIEINL